MTRYSLHRWWRVVAVTTCSVLVSIGIATAQTIPFFWESIDVQMDVRPNGQVYVTETQTYYFTQQHTTERYRYIPLKRVDNVEVLSVSENGKELPFETQVENNSRWVRWQHSLNAPETHTFVLKYRVDGGLQRKGNQTVVYWKALFRDRAAPINRGGG